MGIVYAPQAPVAGAYASALQLGRAQQAAAARDRAAAASSGGYSAAVDPAVVARMIESDADRTQAAIANRDRMDFEARRSYGEMDQRQSLVGQQASQESALLGQRIQGQMALQENELSQQEKIRYMRLKNALGGIEADPTLTPEDKQAYRTMLNTGINPYEQRLARQKVEAQAQANQMLADQRRTQAALNEADLKLSAQGFNERTAYHVDPSIISNIVKDLKANLPLADKLDPKILIGMANEIAMEQGLGQSFYQEKAGQWVPTSGGKVSKSSASGASGDQSFDGQFNEQTFSKFYDSAVDQAMKEQQKKDGSGEDAKFIHPQGADWTSSRVRQIMSDRLDAMRAFLGTQPQKQGYRSPFAKPVATVASADEESRAKTEIDNGTRDANRLAQREDVDPQLKFQALTAYQNAKLLIDKYKTPDRMPEDAKKKLREYQKIISSVPRDPSVTSPPSQPASKPVPTNPGAGLADTGYIGVGG